MKEVKNQQKIIRDHVIWSLAGGIIPVPFLDIAAVSAVQLDMIKELLETYDEDYSAFRSKAWISSLAGSTLPKIAASGIKLLPGVGTGLGILAMSIFSAASTYAIGNVILEHFSAGGTIETFDASNYRELFKVKFKEGRKVAKEYRDKMAAHLKKVAANRKLKAVKRLK